MKTRMHQISSRWVSLGAVLCLLFSGRGSGASVQTPSNSPGSFHKPLLMTSNPHLHIPAPASANPHVTAPLHTPPVLHPDVGIVRVVHETWTPRWDPHAYIALHRGLGVIEGFAHNAAGSPIAGVRIALQHPGGRPFANVALKHITFTGTDGKFVMTNVRPGGYRVYAMIRQNNKPVKRNQHKDVHAGEMVHVNVDI